MKALAVILVATTCYTSFASAEESISDADHILKPLVGKRIQVEGLAWGAFAKGLGERIVLPSGDKFYLTGKNYLRKHPNGSLVRLVGRLSIKTMEPAPPGAQGYTQRFRYYSVEVESFELIDKALRTFPIEVRRPAIQERSARRKE